MYLNGINLDVMRDAMMRYFHLGIPTYAIDLFYDVDLRGRVTFSERLIEINPTHGDSQILSTLLHELVHAFLYHTGKNTNDDSPDFIQLAKQWGFSIGQLGIPYRHSFTDKKVYKGLWQIYIGILRSLLDSIDHTIHYKRSITRMKHANYTYGVMWIAQNDEPMDLNHENVKGYISTLLLADLFSQDPVKVAEDIISLRTGNVTVRLSRFLRKQGYNPHDFIISDTRFPEE